MDTLQAFAIGGVHRNDPKRVFDWDKAAQLIKDQQPELAGAGLRNDWEWTGGDIYRDGQPVPADDTYTYLASTWAIPELSLDGALMECWCWLDGTGWDAGTYWPASALAILNA